MFPPTSLFRPVSWAMPPSVWGYDFPCSDSPRGEDAGWLMTLITALQICILYPSVGKTFLLARWTPLSSKLKKQHKNIKLKVLKLQVTTDWLERAILNLVGDNAKVKGKWFTHQSLPISSFSWILICLWGIFDAMILSGILSRTFFTVVGGISVKRTYSCLPVVCLLLCLITHPPPTTHPVLWHLNLHCFLK